MIIRLITLQKVKEVFTKKNLISVKCRNKVFA